MGQLEDYIAGVPLSAENAALMAGEEPAAEVPARRAAQGSNIESVSGELTDEDRQWLRRLYHEPGFQIFFRMLNCAIHNREESAKVLSQNDPLANAKAIVDEWAYIACFKTVVTDMRTLIQQNMSDS